MVDGHEDERQGQDVGQRPTHVEDKVKLRDRDQRPPNRHIYSQHLLQGPSQLVPGVADRAGEHHPAEELQPEFVGIGALLEEPGDGQDGQGDGEGAEKGSRNNAGIVVMIVLERGE